MHGKNERKSRDGKKEWKEKETARKEGEGEREREKGEEEREGSSAVYIYRWDKRERDKSCAKEHRRITGV